MYISTNWIKDYVDLDGINLEELINRFTLSVAEVEGITRHGENIKNVITVKIVQIEEISESNKLRLIKVNTGNQIITCLCGAGNIKVGDIVPFARIGSIVNGMEVKQIEIAGHISNGMCLSEKELGISDDNSGVMILNRDTKIGVNIKELLAIDDIVFEVDNKSLTNRPDLWGHYGIAREIAALTGRKLKSIEIDDLRIYNVLKEVNVNVEDSKKCYRYSAIEIENINNNNKLNINKRIRLYYCGMRSVSLLVDLTNYIMLELGQPMHAYDKKMIDNIVVKSIKNNVEFKTIDGVVRNIDKGTLMICSNDKPIAIAGIMGGENSEITNHTTSLVLESANFDSVCIRKSAVDIKLRTDASAHYEKSLDPEMTDLAIKRYVRLLRESNKEIKIVSRLTDIYIKKYPEIKIEITKEYINSRIGVQLSLERIKEILQSLKFEIEEKGEILNVRVPSFRATKDVSIKADLVEEIARIYGYDNIKPQTKEQPVRIVEIENEKRVENNIKDLLSIKFGLSEIHTYIWYDKKKNKELNIEVNEDNIKLANSLNANFNILRESMIPSLLYAINENIKYFSDVNIFECGRTFMYPEKGKDCIENKKVGIILCSKNNTSKQLIYKGIQIINSILSLNKNIKVKFDEIENIQYNWISSINSADIKYENISLGYISELNFNIKDNIDKKANIIIIELNMDNINKIKENKRMYREFSKYQSVDIDISVLVDKHEKYSSIEKCINSTTIENLSKYELIDIFENDEKFLGKKSITIRFTLLSKEHTLSSNEINENLEKLISEFEKNGYIVKK